MNRRTFFKVGLAGLATLSIPSHEPLSQNPKEILKPSPSHFGVNINMRALEYYKKYGLDSTKTLEWLLRFGEYVRIPIPLDVVAIQKEGFSYKATDKIMEKAIQKGKKIFLQLGIKTIGYPEINVPAWMRDEFPSISGFNVQLDTDEKLKEFLMEYIEQTSKRYGNVSQVVSIQVENEAHSKGLDLAQRRWISQAFNQQETQKVQENLSTQKLFLQNIPLDTIDVFMTEGLPLLKRSDIQQVGVNMYPQCPTSSAIEALAQKYGFWIAMRIVFGLIKAAGKQPIITEYQLSPWLINGITHAHPFSLQKAMNGIEEILRIDPNTIVFLWDAEQAKARGDTVHIAAIESLAT